MLVKMRTAYASARGNCDAGKVIDLPENEAREIIAGRFGVAVVAKAPAPIAVSSETPEAPDAETKPRKKK